MRQEEPGRAGPIGPLAALRKIIPFEPAASSDQLGWAGLQAARYRAAPASELNPPALNHHRLILFSRPPEEPDLLYEGVERRGSARRRVAGQRPGRPPDPTCPGAPTAYAQAGRHPAAREAPRRRRVHRGTPGRQPDPGADGCGRPAQPLPLRTAVQGGHRVPPHQYFIVRRVERAKQILQRGDDLSLAQVAARAGFSDQSQFSYHSKRLVGVNPGQFRTPARIA
jgi:hypothetical protein